MVDALANVDACVHALRRCARSLLRDPQEVDDLVHDCLVRALDKLHTYRGDGNIRAWMFAIMHNLYVSRARRNQKIRARTAALEEANEEDLALCATQEGYMHAHDLLRALDGLSDDQRSVLLLVSVEDLSYAEVAQVLGIPIGTVMSRLSRARERLPRMMDGDTRPALRRVN